MQELFTTLSLFINTHDSLNTAIKTAMHPLFGPAIQKVSIFVDSVRPLPDLGGLCDPKSADRRRDGAAARMVRAMNHQKNFYSRKARYPLALLVLLLSALQNRPQLGVQELEITSVYCSNRRPYRCKRQVNFEIWGCLQFPEPHEDEHLKLIDEAISASGLHINRFRLNPTPRGLRAWVLEGGLFARTFRNVTSLDLTLSAECCEADEIETAMKEVMSCCAQNLKHLTLSTQHEKNVTGEEPDEDEEVDDWSIVVGQSRFSNSEEHADPSRQVALLQSTLPELETLTLLSFTASQNELVNFAQAHLKLREFNMDSASTHDCGGSGGWNGQVPEEDAEPKFRKQILVPGVYKCVTYWVD